MTEQASPPFTAAAFARMLEQKKLAGTRCTDCGSLYLPPRAICPHCHSSAMAWQDLAGRGRVTAFTSIYVAPSNMVAEGYDRSNPYCAGIVELDEGVSISARLLGVDARRPEQIRIGTPVTVEFLESGEGDARKTILAFRAAG